MAVVLLANVRFLGVVNVRILGVVNVLLVNDSQTSDPIKNVLLVSQILTHCCIGTIRPLTCNIYSTSPVHLKKWPHAAHTHRPKKSDLVQELPYWSFWSVRFKIFSNSYTNFQAGLLKKIDFGLQKVWFCLICWVDQNSQNSTKTDFRVPKMPPIKRCISMCRTPMQADLDPTNWWGVRQGQNGLNLASEDKCDLKKWCCVINEFEGLQEKLAELINLYKTRVGSLPTNKHIIQLLQWLQILQDLPPEWSWRADPTVRSQMCNALEFYFTQSESLGNQISESWAACSQ